MADFTDMDARTFALDCAVKISTSSIEKAVTISEGVLPVTLIVADALYKWLTEEKVNG